MNRSKTLFQIQQYDSELDNSHRRIKEIDIILNDHAEINKAISAQDELRDKFEVKQKQLQQAEHQVEDQSLKIDQNQKKLYSGTITNPKELEDLQMESDSLSKYLTVLEERQLEAMIEHDQAKANLDQASAIVEELSNQKQLGDKKLKTEKNELEIRIRDLQDEKESFLNSTEIPDLATYEKLRKNLNGIAVTQMISNSCSSCGSNIPSAIAQEARSAKALVNCPTCKRILHSG
jgi:predicted  nucleic acid-binding Zn-ribbon protein